MFQEYMGLLWVPFQCFSSRTVRAKTTFVLRVLDGLERHLRVGDRVGAVPLGGDLGVGDVQPEARGVRKRGHDVRREVGLPRCDQLDAWRSWRSLASAAYIFQARVNVAF